MTTTLARICKIHERACVDQGDDVVCPVGQHFVRRRTYKPSDEETDALRARMSVLGKKGGPARAAALSQEHRSEIARQASRARWGKRG